MEQLMEVTPRLDRYVAELEAAGFAVSRRQRSFLMYEDIKRDLLRYLVDDKQQGFHFARFKDEILDLKVGNESWECFGRTRLGHLVVVPDGSVRLIIEDDDPFDGVTGPVDGVSERGWVTVNRDMETFAGCLNLYLSRVARLRSDYARNDPNNSEGLDEAMATFSASWRDEFAELDPTCVDDNSMWPVQMFVIEDDMFYPFYSPYDAELEGRFVWNVALEGGQEIGSNRFGAVPGHPTPEHEQSRTSRRQG